ncbi:universal stress protein [Thermodesulfobacterium hydrogeniphilum]|uniref:universal stress protein n=1 Tax=Thermodesulfobacterium hydrogeniphilum TaxID=161156 RepID=UPI000570923F|nr:universal stress protein [Thermodesulfobacterium hydrogeniphilum]
MNKPIALAIDFKEFTSIIIESGVFLAQNVYTESKIVLFHAIEYFFTPPVYLLPYLNKEKENIYKELEKLTKLFKEKNFSVEIHVLLGNFWEVLENFISRLKPEVLVLGYKSHIFKVPTAEKMLEKLKCNFLVVKKKPLQKIKNILCAIDFSEFSPISLKKAFFLTEKLKCNLNILNIVPPLGIQNSKLQEKYLENTKKEIEKSWHSLLQEIKIPFVPFNFYIRFGDRLEEIDKFIKETQTDLLIIGKRGKELKEGLGFLTKEILYSINIPIFIVEN